MKHPPLLLLFFVVVVALVFTQRKKELKDQSDRVQLTLVTALSPYSILTLPMRYMNTLKQRASLC